MRNSPHSRRALLLVATALVSLLVTLAISSPASADDSDPDPPETRIIKFTITDENGKTVVHYESFPTDEDTIWTGPSKDLGLASGPWHIVLEGVDSIPETSSSSSKQSSGSASSGSTGLSSSEAKELAARDPSELTPQENVDLATYQESGATAICAALAEADISPSQVVRQSGRWVYIGDQTPRFPAALMSSIWGAVPECQSEPSPLVSST